MNGTVKIAVVGCGRMGRAFIDAMQADGRYVIAAVSDTSEAARNFARARLPHAAVYPNGDTLFADAGKLGLDAVGLFTLADARPDLIRQALACDLHVLAEKPIATDAQTGWRLVETIEATRASCPVNLFIATHVITTNPRVQSPADRSASTGFRVCHITPGLMPARDRSRSAKQFHDCGRHSPTSHAGTHGRSKN